MICSFSPVLALRSLTNGQIYSDAYKWIGENLRQTVIAVLLVLFLVLMVWGIYKLIRKKQKRKADAIKVESAAVEKRKEIVSTVTLSDTEMNTKDNNQLGRSIVKAAWIIGISAVSVFCLFL